MINHISPEGEFGIRVRRWKRALDELLAPIHQNPPTVLYHYTDANGLNGIMREGLLWATDSRYLNDSTEVDHGLKLVREVIKEPVWADLSQPGLLVLHAIDDTIDEMLASAGVFVTCFCEQEDLLSQWRGYGGRGGCSIGFESATFLKQAKARSEGGLALRKVIYDADIQRQLLRSAFEIVLPHVKKPTKASDVSGFITPLANILGEFIIECIASFKHPTFVEEAEWRLIRLTPFASEGEALRFRPGVGLMAPYVELTFPDGGQDLSRLPICSITHGPSLHPELAKMSLKALLGRHAYTNVSVRGSNVPLRI